MTYQSSDEIYTLVASLACDIARVITRDKVIDNKIPLALLYEQMIHRKEITPLRWIDEKKKLEYWNETKGNKFQRIIQAQALYMFDLMTEGNERTEN